MMANTTLKQQIIAASQRVGIDKIGFTTAADFEHLRAGLVKQKADGHITGFEHQNLDERLNPDLIFDNPKTLISIALAYPARLKNQPPRTGLKRGQFARASWGEDYHFILDDHLEALIAAIKALLPADSDVRFKPMVDTGELIDVAVAQRAGVGFIGKNGLLITPEFGSFVYLGEIVTNLELEPDEPMACRCGDCTRCIDACPPRALMGNGQLNGQRCLSYQTQTKGQMPDEFRPLIRNVIYGCDICQVVCPFNRGVDNHLHERMEPDVELVRPELTPMLTQTNREFKESFGPMAGSWRGKKPLQRNAIIAIANLNDTSSLPKLLEVIENDPRPLIRATAAYAVGRLSQPGNTAVAEFLQAAYETERDNGTDESLLQEYVRAIEQVTVND
ncbi:(Fe-S)-binding protein [Secundilactobacillus similis DSM 23365 = JCM 2765]|uniref:(Fe-S)-binding protein n=2 Tax=Secundilactobacillus similis TaxID=414682 RepID=A0A0R2EZ11_9LACO|nr:(Fe-S)-binding protein [Secundilactobacillus similis DSM 23365 = JCM 2765]